MDELVEIQPFTASAAGLALHAALATGCAWISGQ